MKTIEDEILLVIPYVNSGQGNELELALTGWRKYCESPLRIIVIGDYNPAIDGKAEYVNCQRVSNIPNQYNPNIDVARKLDKIYDMFHEEYDHFVLANDDEYPIRPFDWKFLTRVTYLQSAFIGNENSPTNYWIHDMWKTRKELDRCKKGHINYCNHHPFYFDMEKFHDISKKFNLANNSLIRENLYYNYYDFKPKDTVSTIRFGFWDNKSPKDKFRSVLSDPKIRFVCNSVAGWSSELMELIAKRYKDDVVKKTIVTENLNLSKGDEKIIVSFTSWKKRIQNCAHIVDLMKNQTLKPDKIILNLSTDEFPQKENELPQDLVKAQDDLFEIYWVKDNTKAFKKVIPTLERYPNEIIISIDDDIEYPKNSIESLYSTYLLTGKNNPVTAGRWDWNGGLHSHLGGLSLFKKEMFYPYLDDLYKNVTLSNGIDIIPFDDALYTYSALLNKRRYVQCSKISGNELVQISPEHQKNRLLHQLDIAYPTALKREHDILMRYIQNKYNVSYNDLLNNSTEKYSYSTEVIDRIICSKQLNGANKLHILVCNLNQLAHTQNIINCLLIQDEDFDLTIFDQNSNEKYTEKYYQDLEKLWPRKNCQLNIIRNPVNAPLNHVWNWFYLHTTNPYIALLNNDIEICDNFVSDAIKIFEKEKQCGIISHPTNVKEFTKKNELEYDIIKDRPYLQGWDIIINRNAYKEIPNELWIYAGDEYLYDKMYEEKKYFQIYDISSPIIHYVSKTIVSNRNEISKILDNDLNIYRKKYKRYNIFENHKYCHRGFIGTYAIDLTKKIIVSFTTWEKRIKNVPHIVQIMSNQTIKPNKIILNLSKEEFKNKMDLVKDILEIEKTNPLFEVNWVEGPNTKVWKKFIPIIDKYSNDLILTIDDDMEYPKDYIENCWNSYLKNPYSPLTGMNTVWYGLQHCCGAFNVFQYKFIKLYLPTWEKVYKDIHSSDTYYIYIHKLNGYDFKPMNRIYYNKIKKYNSNNGYSENCMKNDSNWTLTAYKYLINKYGDIHGFKLKR